MNGTRGRRGWRGWSRGWRRELALRRLAAGLLAVLAVGLAVRPAVAPDGRVVVARHDTAPGATLGAADVEVRAVPAGAVPAGAVVDPAAVVGRRPLGPIRAGEALTDVRLVGPEAAVAAAGTPDAAGVPVRLADPAVAGLVRPGAAVDVIGAAGATPPTGAGGGIRSPDGSGAANGSVPAEVLAAHAVVLDVLPAAERSGTPPVVVVALPGPVAARVAAATLGQEVTVTLR